MESIGATEDVQNVEAKNYIQSIVKSEDSESRHTTTIPLPRNGMECKGAIQDAQNEEATNNIQTIVKSEDSERWHLTTGPLPRDSMESTGATQDTQNVETRSSIQTVTKSEPLDSESLPMTTSPLPGDSTGASSLSMDRSSTNTSYSRETEGILSRGDNDPTCSSAESDLKSNDEYFYTKRAEFTSELFKIEVKNLPKYSGFKELRKMVNKVGVFPKKIKYGQGAHFSYMSFGSELEREEAIAKLNGQMYKGKQLLVKMAKPKADPLVLKRKSNAESDYGFDKKNKTEDGQAIDTLTNIDPAERLLNSVTPLWKVPYSEQLKKKEISMRTILGNVTRLLKPHTSSSWVKERSEKNNGLCCCVQPIKPSPVTENYRNKVEFNVGQGLNGGTDEYLHHIRNRLIDAGHNVILARKENFLQNHELLQRKNGQDFPYNAKLLLDSGLVATKGHFGLVEPTACINITEEAKKIAKCFQEYIKISEYPPYDAMLHTGYWRQLTVRTCRSSQAMVIVQIHPQQLTEKEIEKIKESLKTLFDKEENKVKVHSLYLQMLGQRLSTDDVHHSFMHIHGSKEIEEQMMDMKFRISPDAFFQVNTCATEVLYSVVRDLALVDENTIILDICCGTGSIGLSMAKFGAQKVIGFELSKQAVDDAKHNALINNVSNATFIQGKAEDTLYSAIRHLPAGSNVVAIVDPPRAGLHNRVIQCIRRCPLIKRLVYVSCNPKLATNNFVDLCRDPTRRNKGSPFELREAVPVDLFPHTDYCELVLLLTKDDNPDMTSQKEESVIEAGNCLTNQSPV